MTKFVELEVLNEIKNENNEIKGFKWISIYVNVDNISHFKEVKNCLRPYNKREIIFSDYKENPECHHLDSYLLKSTDQSSLKDSDFNEFMDKYIGYVSFIFNQDVYPSYDAIEIHFKSGVNPMGRGFEGKPIVSSCGLRALGQVVLRTPTE